MGLLTDYGFTGTAGWALTGDAGRVSSPYLGYALPDTLGLPGTPGGQARLGGVLEHLGGITQWFHVSEAQVGAYQLKAFVNANPAWLDGLNIYTTLSIDEVPASSYAGYWNLEAYDPGSWWAAYANAQYFPGGAPFENIRFEAGWHVINITVLEELAATDPNRSIFFTDVDFDYQGPDGGLVINPTPLTPPSDLFWVRLRHASGQGFWQSKGDVTEEWAGGVKRIQLPFPTMDTPPLSVMGKEPITGLPMWATAADLVPKDTGDGPVPAATVVQTAPHIDPVPVPTPVVDHCPQIRCGAAYQVSVKLKDQYDLIRGLLLWMLSAPFLLRLPLGIGAGGTTVIEFLVEQLLRWMTKNGVAIWAIAVVTAVLGAAQSGLFGVDTSFEDIGEAGRAQLQLLAYTVLACSDNTFKLTPAMVANWAARIDADTTDFSEWQRHLLVYCIQFTPFSTYDQTAASGALAPSDACSGWTGP